MKRKFYLGTLLFLVVLTGCMIDEAQPLSNPRIIIYSDSHSIKDTAILQAIEKKTGIRSLLVYKPAEVIDEIISTNQYQISFDILLISNESLRRKLQIANLLTSIKTNRDKSMIQRQFYHNHDLWIPICHDPLVYVQSKDSSTTCFRPNWTKLRNSKTQIYFKDIPKDSTVYHLLEHNKRFHFLLDSKNIPSKKEYITSLSNLIRNTPINKPTKYCYFYVVDNQKYLSQETTVSIYKYARNKKLAHTFLEEYLKHKAKLASNRNQLPVYKHINPNNRIKALNIQ